jgi:hypothetical protein
VKKGPYRTLWEVFQRYRRDYGGFRQLVYSPFFHISIVIGVLLWADNGAVNWHAFVVSTFPTVLGFSLAAYTLTFAFMGTSLHQALRSAVHPDTNNTLIRMVNATFFHVVLIQSSVLIYSVASQSTLLWEALVQNQLFGRRGESVFHLLRNVDDLVGSILTVYGLTLMISVAVGMFRLGTIGRGTPRAPLQARNDAEPLPPLDAPGTTVSGDDIASNSSTVTPSS